MHNKDNNILVVGLGYVGLPLAIELSYYFKVGGYDIDERKINKLNRSEDEKRIYTLEQLNNIPNISFSNDPK